MPSFGTTVGAAGALAFLLFLPDPTAAQAPSACYDRGADYDVIVAACTRDIQNTDMEGEDLATALARRCWALGGLQRYDEANMDCLRAFRLAPKDSYVSLARAFLEYDNWKFEEAILLFERSIMLGGDDTFTALVYIGHSYQALNEYQNAERFFTLAIKFAPHDYRPYCYRAEVRALSWNADLAFKDVAMAQRLASGSSELAAVHYARALTFYWAGQPESAVAHAEKSVALDPAKPRYELQLAYAYAALGAEDDALLHFETAARLGGPNLVYHMRWFLDWNGHHSNSLSNEYSEDLENALRNCIRSGCYRYIY